MDKNIDCEYHDNEIYTNFCCLLNCLTPLCPDCINDHNKMHLAINDKPEVDTIKRVTNNCKEKLNDLDIGLKDQYDRINAVQQISIDELIDQIKADLNKVKNIIKNQMDIYFENLEKEVVNSLKNKNIKLDFTPLLNEISNLINTNNSLIYGLNNEINFDYLKQSIKIDSEKILEEIKNKVDKEIELKVDLPIQVVLNKNRIENFGNIMNEIIYLQNKTIKLNQNHKEDVNFEETFNKIKKTKGYFNSKFKN